VLHRKAGVVHHPAFDAPLDEGGSYGMRWDGGQILVMLRIEAPHRGLTLLGPGTVVANQVVPLAELAGCVTQPDLGLVSVDVISLGSRIQPVGEMARIYEQVVGPLPATWQRTVWLVLRVDPLRIAEDVRSRAGGGSSGVVRSAILVTRSIASYLASLGITVSVLSAAEQNESVTQLTDGIPFDELAETRHHTRHRNIRLSSFAVDPMALNSRVLTNVWSTPSRSTTLTVRLRPAPDGTVALTAVVRFHTKTVLPQIPVVGLKPLPGKQYRALLSTLPIGGQRHKLSVEPRYCLPESLTAIGLPVAGCGQLLGANSDGYAVAAPLFGPRVRRVNLVGGLYPAHQIVLRALALGARVLVHTERPQEWLPFARLVDSPSLVLAAPDQIPAEPTATLIVFDDIPAPAQVWHATVLAVGSAPPDTPQPAADITLTQDPDSPGVVTATVPTDDEPLGCVFHLVATPDEIPYLAAVLPVPANPDQTAETDPAPQPEAAERPEPTTQPEPPSQPDPTPQPDTAAVAGAAVAAPDNLLPSAP
jgi:type VII secretion protein EccE